MKVNGKKLVVIALAATFFGASISSLAEEMESRKLSIMQVSGDLAYIKKGNNREFKAIKGMGLAQGNQVSTGEDSTIYIESDNDKVIRLDEKSLVEITKASAKSLKLTLRSGNIFFNVDKPLASDEEMVFEAAHTSMSIRGTSGVFVFNPLKMEFYLIEGSVSWDIGNGQNVEIKAGESIAMERDLSSISLGPGVEGVYTFTKKVPFSWTDLDEDSLEAVIENRAKIDLNAIGLDTPEKIQQAVMKVDEYKKSKETLKKVHATDDDKDDDEDDDFYEDETSTTPPTQSSQPTPPASETDSNENTNGDGNEDTGNDTGTDENQGSDENISSDSNAETSGSTTEEYYVTRIDGPRIDNGTYDLRPGENGTYFGMTYENETWYWKWARYNDTYGSFVNDTWEWSSPDYPDSFDDDEFGLNDLYFLYPAEEIEALIPTE